MRVTDKKFIIALLIGLLLLGMGQVVWAEKWQPYQFKGNEYFEFKILFEENEGTEESIYILDIKESSEKSTSGEEVFEVTYTTKGTLTKDELGPETAFGLMGSYGISAGIIKVIGKEKIAGREGFVCQLFQADEEEKMIAEWVIDPDLALPLRSKIFDDNELQGQIELVKYMRKF
jgi:hypothetical protein